MDAKTDFILSAMYEDIMERGPDFKEELYNRLKYWHDTCMSGSESTSKSSVADGSGLAPTTQENNKSNIDIKYRYFRYEHLPPHLQKISKPYADFVDQLRLLIVTHNNIDNEEANRAFESLLDSKDRLVRSFLSANSTFF